MQKFVPAVMVLAAAALFTSGCTTASLSDGGQSQSRTSPTPTNRVVNQLLLEDELVAFGRPAQPLTNLPNANLVIVGEKNSYVLTQGGSQMQALLTRLPPQNIRVESDMRFVSPNNDGYFQGSMALSYTQLVENLDRDDYQFFIQQGATECSTASDTRMGAQRFCFEVPIQGAVYPAVSNLSLIQAQSQYQALSRPYAVRLYTQQTVTAESNRQQSRYTPVEKLILLPFALAFDVITLPLQILGQ